MSVECCGSGALSKLALGLSTGTPTRMDFLEFRPQIVKTLADGSVKAIRGTLDHQSTSVAEGLLHVRFRISMWLTSAKFNVLAPMLGFVNTSGTGTVTWQLEDVLPDVTVVVGPTGAPEDTYAGCVCTDFVISGQKGANPIMIDMGFVGKTWATAANGTFFVSQSSPAMLEGYTYPFGQGANNVSTLNVLGQALSMPQFKLSVDNKVIQEFNNSVTATNLCPTDHEIKFGTSALYSTCDGNTALWTVPMAGTITGAAITLTMERTVSGTNDHATVFTIGNAKSVAQSYRITKNDFNRLPLQFEGYAVGSTPALVVTNTILTP